MTEQATRRRRAPSRRAVLVGLGALTIAWAGLLAWSALSVQGAVDDGPGALLAARDHLVAAEVDAAVEAFEDADGDFGRLAFHVGAPWVAPLRLVPGLGDDVRFAARLADDVAGVAEAGLALSQTLDEAVAALDAVDGRLPVEVAEQLVAPVAVVADRLDAVDATVADGAEGVFVAPVAEFRDELATELADVREQAHLAARLTAAVPTVLGADAPRTYLLFASNPAELRGTGGYLGSYALMTIDDGALDIGAFNRLSNLQRMAPDAVEPPNEDFLPRYRVYGGTGDWQNANLTPDFPSAAQVLEGLYEARFGTAVDGVVAVDPFAYEALLRIGGPVELPGLPTVTADTVVDYVTRDAYLDFDGDPETRQEQLGQVAAAALQNFLSSSLADDLGSTVDVLATMLSAGHLRVHVADPEAQAALAEAGIDGALEVDGPDGQGGDYLGVVVNNGAANKVDVFVQRDVAYEVSLRADGGVDGKLAVTLFNNAPAEGPRYVLGPNAAYLEAGEVYALLSVYCGRGCFVADAPPSLELFAVDFRRRERVVDDLDGRRSAELGSQIVDTWVSVPAGRSRTYDFAFTQPDAWERTPDGGIRYRLVWDNQVTLRATGLTVVLEVPDGFEVAGAPAGAEVEDGRVTIRTGGIVDQVLEVLLAPA